MVAKPLRIFARDRYLRLQSSVVQCDAYTNSGVFSLDRSTESYGKEDAVDMIIISAASSLAPGEKRRTTIAVPIEVEVPGDIDGRRVSHIHSVIQSTRDSNTTYNVSAKLPSEKRKGDNPRNLRFRNALLRVLLKLWLLTEQQCLKRLMVPAKGRHSEAHSSERFPASFDTSLQHTKWS